MHLTRDRKRKLLIATAVAGVVVLFAAFLLWRVAERHPDAGPDSAVPSLSGPTPTTGPSAKPAAKPSAKASAKGSARLPVGLPTSFGDVEFGPGLLGGSSNYQIPTRRIVLSAYSPRPMSFVGYFVPTSPDNKSGTVKSPGKSWSIRTVGYGKPDYARIFLQSDGLATPVSCTITVDGKVTAHETTKGPYGRIMCQG